MIIFVSPPLLVIIGLLALVVLTVISWRSLISGIYVLTLLLPSYLIRFKLVGIPTTILELAIIIVFLIWLLRNNLWRQLISLSARRINLVPISVRWLLSIILLTATLSAITSPNQLAAWGEWKAYFLEPIMIFLVCLYTIRSQKQIEIILRILGLLVLLLFPLGLIQYITGWSIPNAFWAAASGRRITTIYSYPNGTSLFITPIIAIFMAWLPIIRNRARQIYSIGVILAGLLLIIWAQTAGAILALSICLLIILWHHQKTRLIAIGLTLLFLIAGIFYLSGNSFQMQWQKIATDQLTLTSSSLEIRIDQWRETFNLLSHNWLLGSGLAGYQTALAPYHQHHFIEIFLYPHNIFLNFWVELGLLGLIAFVWLWWFLLRPIWSKKKSPALAWGISLGLLAILIHGMVDVPYFRNDLSLLFFILVALSLVLQRTTEPILTTDN